MNEVITIGVESCEERFSGPDVDAEGTGLVQYAWWPMDKSAPNGLGV